MPRKSRHGDNPEGEACPVEYTLERIGGKWKGILLYHLMDSAKRFGELRSLCPAITLRMLALQLRELEEDGIVRREVYKQVPPRVEYSLTEYGLTLKPIILLMKEWGESHKRGHLAPCVPRDEAQPSTP
ncbi:putative HTH-type transcriptional regulator YybR [Cohnella xylanilytica]|uniref:Helix-turn-helix transcriptional regulator n=1 Tax=Cohnella xylanilytica TaxID=557555 RepID=A0A841UAS2_9BACL|nr:helix-turn-helix domain-containing protein [Cohnella xylanilytica]MBB6695244.1 helix-turn-helix transcriptional regulator [Cohnella xylanilytica]GIO13151.1 putative HTH-type transcriptional regulator YybR [Cohnella xylanilytica]